ncbi:hypothetical protein K493DRAFT_301514 [Basidiobolus meristosporus CBS 931.73]|uniref:Helicase C-terminal domain-containing protein n=1 Tax=Basidiobolus meristosporus CBS 931.73 TaxID=1314790 RepID=A0A1Y1YBN5_9FUNG|nr:hypothetical protein K493DRAFT_301514 [Basidiobolus meristosporus CBS 931.73]|eukprot:ORX95397.1 hypothetical protein K493DRAFT_301514 [Basidiobolus meristosporus CBS 931.73]
MSEDDFLPEIDEDLEVVAVEVEEQLQEINSKDVDSSSNVPSTSAPTAIRTKDTPTIAQRGLALEDSNRVFIQDFLTGVTNNTVNKHSGKTRKIMEILLEIQENKEHARVVIFSGFNLMLDIVAYHLREQSIEHLKITGSTPVWIQKSSIDTFALPVPEGEICVLLINIKCGAFGLNLQMASAVIIANNW